MRGDSSISTVTSSTRWCSTRLCLTNCVSASGTPFGVEARNTAVPGNLRTAFADGGLDQILFGLAQFGARAFSTSLTPLRQVSIRNAMTAASTSGNQPPS